MNRISYYQDTLAKGRERFDVNAVVAGRGNMQRERSLERRLGQKSGSSRTKGNRSRARAESSTWSSSA